MQLFEALKLIRDRNQAVKNQAAVTLRSFDLVCGFTPLHLRTLLTAALIQRIEDSPIAVEIGLFDDLLGNIERISADMQLGDRAEAESHSGAAIIVEWSDLDSRLGRRSTRGWRPDRADDILSSVGVRLEQLSAAIAKLAERTSVAVCLPSLPLPPMFLAPTTTSTALTSRLRSRLHEFAAALAEVEVRVLDEQSLHIASPLSERLDVASELRSGFPYRVAHAGVLAAHFAAVLRPEPILKGIITDLDNTLWAGIVGEDGVESVSWDLDHKTQHHGLYQEQLASLADSGTLLAIASKNEARIAERALDREDLVVSRDRIFPIEANWRPKSESVARILEAWNIAPDAVMFIDDSPIELAEVAQAFPELHCRQFPTHDESAVLDLLTELRNRFGRTAVSAEDKLRVASLRASAELKQTSADPESFLANAEAQLCLSWNQPDARSLELLNKTNQFNLNGRRIEDAEWHRRLSDAQTFLLSVSYQDKFAPLGKIAVALGASKGVRVEISAWVMSCRAFSRRIEYGTLQAIFERFNCREIHFDFQPTDRNGPLQTVLQQLNSSGLSDSGSASGDSNDTSETTKANQVTVTRQQFDQYGPRTYFEVSNDDNQRHSIPA